MKARSYLLGAVALLLIIAGATLLVVHSRGTTPTQAPQTAEQPSAEATPQQETQEPAAQTQTQEPAAQTQTQASPTQTSAPQEATPQSAGQQTEANPQQGAVEQQTPPATEAQPQQEVTVETTPSQVAVAARPEQPAAAVQTGQTTPPTVAILSPAAKSTYGSTVTVQGRASATAGAAIDWTLGASGPSGQAQPGTDGAFSFSFSTIGLKGDVTVSARIRGASGAAAQASVTLADRAAGPALVIDSPEANAAYGEEVAVSGRAGNPSDPSGGPAEVKSVAWRVVGVSSLTGEAAPDAAGAFRFAFSTKGLSGTLALEVLAVDLNGRSTTRVLTMSPPATSAGQAETGAKEALRIAVSSPKTGGYYQDIIVIQGAVAGIQSASDLKSFSYDVTGGTGLTGRIALNDAGAFKVPLSLSSVKGDITVVLLAEGNDGRQERSVLLLHDGRLKPVISLSSPKTDGTYGSLLRVSGTVADPYAGQSGMEGIDSLAWLLSPVEFSRAATPTRGTAAVGSDGSFRFTIGTQNLSGSQNLTLTAAAKNGNKAEMTVKLAQGQGDLSAFATLPADRAVTVSWDPLPFAVRYDISWAAGDQAPDKGQTRTGVSSGVTLKGLENGTLYSLQVRVTFDDGGTGASSVARVIPLSPQTLSPVISSGFLKVELKWNSVPGATGYEVWRSLASNGDYTRIAENLPVTSFVDSTIEFGRSYWYQIAPFGVTAPRSAAVAGKSQPYPEERIVKLGSAPSPSARSLTLSGGYVFAALGEKGIQIVDVSTPMKPLVIGELATDNAWDVAVRSDYAYVADGESGLEVLDISAPTKPVLLGSRKTIDARAVEVSGSYAIVADGEKGLKVIAIDDVKTLNRVATMETTNAQDLALVGTTLYVADGAGGLLVVDVKKPTALSLMGSLAMNDARAVAVEGGIAVVADGAGGLLVVDVSDAAHPRLLATYAMAMAATVASDARFAYVGDGRNGISVVDLQDPAKPRLFTTYAAAGVTSLGVNGQYAYIADTAGVEVARIQIAGRSFSVASCKTGGKAFDVTLVGAWAYVAGHSLGLSVVNASDPGGLSDASLAGTLETRSAQEICVQDKYAYVADGSNGIRIIDVSPAWASPPSPPVEVGSYRPGGAVGGVALSGSTVYITEGSQGVHLIDVSTPSAPTEIASVRTTNACAVLVRGTWAFIADGDAGLRVLDVSTPAKPSLLDAVVKGSAKCLALTGNLLLIGGAAGVTAVDVSDPGSPRLLGSYASTSVEAVAAEGTRGYVAEGFKGLTVLDLSQPERLQVVSACADVYAVGVAVKGNYAFVADTSSLKVVQVLIPDWLNHS